MATLENIGLIGVYGAAKSRRVLLKLQFSDGSIEQEKFNNGDSILVDGNKVAEISAIGESSVDILQTATGETFTFEVGEIGEEQEAEEIIPSAQGSEPVTFDDVSGRTSTPEPVDFSDISFPTRRGSGEDAATFDQTSVLDFGKMTPLREESITPETSTGEFNAAKYRVGQINENAIEGDAPTALIYDYTTNVTIGNYKKGDVIPQFENRVVENVDADAKTVTLDDGSVIQFTPRTDIKDREDALNRKVDTFTQLSDEQKEQLKAELNSPQARENNAVAVDLGDGRVAVVYQSPDEPLSYNQAVALAQRTGGRLPTAREATAIMQNADVKVAYDLPDGAVDGVPAQGVDIYREAAARAYNLSPGQFASGRYKFYTNDSGVPGFIGLWKPSFGDFIQGDINRATTLGGNGRSGPHNLDYGNPNYGPDRTHRAIIIKNIVGG